MGPFVFGKINTAHCIQDLPWQSPQGDAVCLAYDVDYYGFVFSAYVRDTGYSIKLKDKPGHTPLDAAMIATLQHQGRLPDPLPTYSVPLESYFWGLALWPMILILVVAAVLRRRVAIRKHAETPPLAPGAAAIEVIPTHSILQFHMFATAPTITIEGMRARRAWGRTWTFPVEPGKHRVAVSYRWIWESGEQDIWVEVEPGEIKRIGYHVGTFLASAKIKEEASMPAARVERSGP